MYSGICAGKTKICDEDVAICYNIGLNGLPLIVEIAKGKIKDTQ